MYLEFRIVETLLTLIPSFILIVISVRKPDFRIYFEFGTLTLSLIKPFQIIRKRAKEKELS